MTKLVSRSAWHNNNFFKVMIRKKRKFTSAKKIWGVSGHLKLVSVEFQSSALIEGLRAKRAYIEFWPIFIFCRIELNFGRLTCFDMESIIP